MQLAHAYLLSARGAARLAADFLPVAFPSDFHLSQLLAEGGSSDDDGGGADNAVLGSVGDGTADREHTDAPYSVWWPSPGLVAQASIEGRGSAASSMQSARLEREREEQAGSADGAGAAELVRMPELEGVKEYERGTLLRMVAEDPHHCLAMTRRAAELLRYSDPEASERYRAVVDAADEARHNKQQQQAKQDEL